MDYGILTHKKTGKVHRLYLDVNTIGFDFIIETSFFASGDYMLEESFTLNDTPIQVRFCPDMDYIFKTNDCVYCVLDMKNNVILITDIHRANFDSLIVFNNFSENPESNFTTQQNVLFSTSVTISDTEKEYADFLLGGCVVLEDCMSEDGLAPLYMNIEILINGEVDYVYAVDCTRKHEILNFDHTFKNLKTNKNINIMIRYSYDNYKYGTSYVGPSIKNNNVTIYIEGSNILASMSSNVFKFRIETDNETGEKFATIYDLLDTNCVAYRFPNVYTDENNITYPVKKVEMNGVSLYNTKYISFANGIEYIDVNYLYPHGSDYSNTIYTAYNSSLELLNSKAITFIFPDYGVKYLNKSTYNGQFFNNNKEYNIHGDPDSMLWISDSLPVANILPNGQYSTLNIDNFEMFWHNGTYDNYAKASEINITGKHIVALKYNPIGKNYSSNYGLTGLTVTESNRPINEPAEVKNINIKCETCNIYQLLYYVYLFFSHCTMETAEKFHFVTDPEDIFFYVHYNIYNLNIEGDLIFNDYLSRNTSIRITERDDTYANDGYCPVSISNNATADINYGFNIDMIPNNVVYSYYSSGTSYADIDGIRHTMIPRICNNITGNVYVFPYVSLYNIFVDTIINGNLYAIPAARERELYYSSYQFGDYYRANMYLYYYNYAYDSCIVKGVYNISQSWYKFKVCVKERYNWSYDDNGNSVSGKYFVKEREKYIYRGIGDSNSLYNYIYNNKSYTKYFRKFHVDTLKGVVVIPTKQDSSSTSIVSIDGKHSYAYLYRNHFCDFKYNKIEPGTAIVDFGEQDLNKLKIDFSKLSCIGNLDYCNITRIEIPTPIIAILKAPSYSNMSRVNNYRYETDSNNEYVYETEDHKWDPSWKTSDDFNSIKYDLYIDFNAVVLGDIFISEYESINQEEDSLGKTLYRNNPKRKEKIRLVEEELAKLSESERETNSTTFIDYEVSEYSRAVMPKNEDIAKGIENFVFNKDSSFSYTSTYEFNSTTGEVKIYPEIKVYDVTKYIGSGFLYGHPYVMNKQSEVYELPASLKWYGRDAFNFRFLDVYKKEDNTYAMKSYISNYATNTIDDVFPLKEIIIGKHLETMENNVFPFADKCTIDPANPNFVIENGYIYSADKTILFRPVCYSQIKAYTKDDNPYVFKSSKLKYIVDYNSLKYDARITGLEITSNTFEIKNNTSAVLGLPENCTRLILPSGEYTISDDDFNKMEYIEFLNITPTSKYYNIPGSAANDIYTNYNKPFTLYNNSQSSTSTNTAFTYYFSGSKLIFAKKNMDVNLPDVCNDIGGSLNTANMEITSTRSTEFAISSPNVRIQNYVINEDGNSNFYTTDDNGKSVLWYRTPVTGFSTVFPLLYKYPNAVDEDTINVSVGTNEFIDANAFKYCSIKSINISSPGRTTDIFRVAGTNNQKLTALTILNDYDDTMYYDKDDMKSVTQYGIGYTSSNSRNKFMFPQPHYYTLGASYNIVALPIRNEKIESLTIDFNPNYLFGDLFGRRTALRVVYDTQSYYSNNYAVSNGYVEHSAGSFLLNGFTLPKVDKLIFNYDFGAGLSLLFPIDHRYKEVHFSNIDSLKSINKMVVCGPDVKIYPETILDNVVKNHNYELYYCTNTNLRLTQTTFTDVVFGEKCGAPFPSDSTVTLNNCFLHNLFIHPSCENINLIIGDDCRFGYFTDFTTSTAIVANKPNIFNQYSDYARTTNSANYTVGNSYGGPNYKFFLLTPTLDGDSFYDKLFSMFTSITTPRLFSFQFRSFIKINSTADEEKYKLGGFYKITQDITFIPESCFNVNCTVYNDNTYIEGYALFEYNQFKQIVSTLVHVAKGNNILIPTNPSGETVYEFSSEFKEWDTYYCSEDQDYIDEWIINSKMRLKDDKYYDKFTGGGMLQYFVKKFTYKNTEANLYYGTNPSHSSFKNCNINQHHILNITANNTVIDMGVFPISMALNAWDNLKRMASSYGEQTYEFTFGADVTNVTILQLQVPNMYSEVLDFSDYPNITFTLGNNNKMSPSSTYWYMNIVRLSGFKKIVMSDNVVLYGDVPSCVFYYSRVETIEFKSGQLYSAMNCEYLTTIIFADTYTDINQMYVSYYTDTICNVNLDNIQTLSKVPGNSTYSAFGDVEYTFTECDLSNTTLASLVSIENQCGFTNCKFAEALDCPELLTIGTYGFRQSRGVKVINLPKVTSIGVNAFAECTDLTTVNAPLLTTVSAYAFYNSRNLNTINAPLLTTIGSNAFYQCGLSGVLILESVETIDSYAFYGNTNITEVHLPKCKSIGANAFYTCTNIRKAYLHPDCVIDATSFYNTTEIDRTRYSG